MVSKNMSLKVKIIVPFVFSFLIMVIALLLVVRYYTLENQKKVINRNVNDKITEIKSNIDRVGKKALLQASSFANLNSVLRAYTEYKVSGDLSTSTQIIRSEFDEMSKSVKRSTDTDLQVHYHLPSSRSFIRTWTDKQGDDLSSFRKTVVEISKNKEPLQGIEVGRGGFVIRGLAPIFLKMEIMLVQ